MTQADLVRLMQRRDKLDPRSLKAGRPRRIQPNTISRIARGFHTQTAILARIAETLGIGLGDLLVSPVRRLNDEERRRYIEQITAAVIAHLEATPPPAAQDDDEDEALAPRPRLRRRRK